MTEESTINDYYDLSPEEVAQIKGLYRQGNSDVVIALLMGTSVDAVEKVLDSIRIKKVKTIKGGGK